MRADRLLSILLLLQVHRKLPATDLARRLEVSERTIHRDMEALAMAGVPVYAERGGNGGWVLPESFRTDVTGLTGDELRSILMTPSRHLADLGLKEAAGAALVKVLAGLPAVARRDAQRMRERVHIDGAGWHGSEEPLPALVTLQEALWLDRRIRFTYTRDQRGFDPAPVVRTADPLGLVAKGRTWYLVASPAGDDRSTGEPRTYRVSRMADVAIESAACERPEGFDLAAYWQQSAARFVRELPKFPVTVRMHESVVSRVWIPGSYAQVLDVGEADGDGWHTVRLLLQTEDEACRYVLGFADQMQVVEPASLAAVVLERAKATVAFLESR